VLLNEYMTDHLTGSLYSTEMNGKFFTVKQTLQDLDGAYEDTIDHTIKNFPDSIKIGEQYYYDESGYLVFVNNIARPPE